MTQTLAVQGQGVELMDRRKNRANCTGPDRGLLYSDYSTIIIHIYLLLCHLLDRAGHGYLLVDDRKEHHLY